MCHITFALHVGGGGGGWRWELKARRPPSQWPQLDTFNIFVWDHWISFRTPQDNFQPRLRQQKKRIFLTEARTSPAVFAPIETPAEQRRVRNTSSSTDMHWRESHFLSCFTSRLCLACQKPDELFFPVCTEMTSWYHNTEIKWCFFTTASWSLKKVRNRTNTSKSKALRTYFVSEPGSVSVGERQQRQCSTL